MNGTPHATSSSIAFLKGSFLQPSGRREDRKPYETRTKKKRIINSQHPPIPPKPLSRYVQTAPHCASFVVRPTHINNQHRSDFHRQDHLSTRCRHYAGFQAGSWERGVPWFLFLLLCSSGGVEILGGSHLFKFGVRRTAGLLILMISVV
jgi:hypothetical protein